MRTLGLLFALSVIGCGSTTETSLHRSSAPSRTAGGRAGPRPPSILARDRARTFAGEITAADAMFEERNSRHDRYRVQLNAGDTLRVVMWSIDFDTFLYVLGPDGDEVGIDDDGAGNLNSFLQIEAETAGVYTVIATTFSAEATGTYALGIRSGTGDMPSPVGIQVYDEGEYDEERDYEDEIANAPVDQTIQGRFSSGDPILPDSRDRHFHDYPIQVQAGETLYIQMRSEPIDCYLYLLGPGGEPVAENDDFNGLNSFIVHEATQTGTYVVRTATFSESETGAYEVLIGRRAAGALAP